MIRLDQRRGMVEAGDEICAIGVERKAIQENGFLALESLAMDGSDCRLPPQSHGVGVPEWRLGSLQRRVGFRAS